MPLLTLLPNLGMGGSASTAEPVFAAHGTHTRAAYVHYRRRPYGIALGRLAWMWS